MNNSTSLWAFLIGILIYGAAIVGSLGIAVLPGIIAFHRRARDRWFILALNLFLGATVVGWVIALVWACRARETEEMTHDVVERAAPLQLLMSDVRRLPIFPREQRHMPTTTDSHSVEQAIDGISRLSTLEEQGYLTTEEFATLKARIIAGRD